MTISSSSCAPRFATARSDRPTYGPEVEAISRAMTSRAGVLGRPFMPWQRDTLSITQEFDPTTGLRHYRTVILVVPRQAGKTTALEAQLTWESQRVAGSTSVYMAQTQNYAGDRLLELHDKRLALSPLFRGRCRPIRSNGRQRIIWANTSLTATSANNDTAGHGLTVNGSAVVDEAFAHVDLTSVNALSPTMVTCPDPQLWIVSTLGDGTDGLLQHFQDVGSASLHDPDTDVCYLEYSAEPGAPTTDPATWWATHPALGHTISERTLRSELNRMGEAEFDRAYLCRRRPESIDAKISPEVWARQYREGVTPAGRYVLAVDVAHDRSSSTIAVVGDVAGRRGELVGIIDRQAGTSWIVPALRDLVRARRPAATVVDRRSPAGSLINRIEAAIGPVLEPDTVQFGMSAGVLYDELDAGTLWHAGQPDLDIAAAQARTRPLGDAWTWNRRESPCDIAPLCALTFATWGHRELFPARPR